MNISRTLAHKLQNMIQTVMSYIELKREEPAKKELRKMSSLIEKYTEESCDDCQRGRKENPE